MKFSPSLAAEELIEAIHHRVGARNKTVLARSALFLALGETIPTDFHPADSQGKDLDDDTIISDELHDLVHAALNHRAGQALDEAAYHHAFRLHFEYGCYRLNEIWQQSSNDPTHFITTLLKNAGDFRLPLLDPNCKSEIANQKSQIPDPMPVVEKEIKLKLLAGAPEWSVNGVGTSNGLLVISGQPGSGKSQLALDLLAQLAGQGVRFVFFDMRGELGEDPNSPDDPSPPTTSHSHFDRFDAFGVHALACSGAVGTPLAPRTRFLDQTGARYIRLIREALPINPLYRDPNPTSNAQIAYEIANLIRCFAPQFGARQEHFLCDAYQRLLEPDFPSLVTGLQYNGTPGVDLAIVQKIDRLKLFASAQTAITPEAWLTNSLVIDFKEFGNDNETKALCAALILNFLMKKLSRNLPINNGIQPLKTVLFVDEAHLLLPKEHKAGLLSSLARQGRSWGFPVWLASQDADKFLTTGVNETNFADLAECGVHFSPHTLTDSQQRMILGGTVHTRLRKGDAALRLQGKLITGPARQFWKDGGRVLPLLLDRAAGEASGNTKGKLGRGEESNSY